MEKRDFKHGDEITLNTGYECDFGKFVRWEGDLCVWRDKVGSTYKSPWQQYNITLASEPDSEVLFLRQFPA